MSASIRTTRPASVAALFVLMVSVVVFAYTLIGMTSHFEMSAWDLLFTNPSGGSTLADALVFAIIPTLLQGAIAFALGRRAVWARVLGSIAAFAIVAACVVWLLVVTAGGIVWVVAGMPTSGTMPTGGDFMDLTGIAVAVPIVSVIGYLNARAALLTVRTLRAA